jgi:hypothetical protein
MPVCSKPFNHLSIGSSETICSKAMLKILNFQDPSRWSVFIKSVLAKRRPRKFHPIDKSAWLCITLSVGRSHVCVVLPLAYIRAPIIKRLISAQQKHHSCSFGKQFQK